MSAVAAVPPLAEQLRLLVGCGISLRPDVTPADLLEQAHLVDLEAVAFVPLLHLLGTPAHTGRFAGQLLAEGIWRFDLECLDGPGDYVRAARQMEVLARGELPLEAVTDHVDPEQGLAWLEYTLDGQTSRWEADWAGDWIDVMPLFYLAEELDQRDAERRFTMLDDDGRYVLVGCATPGEHLRLRRLTGLEFEWFTES